MTMKYGLTTAVVVLLMDVSLSQTTTSCGSELQCANGSTCGTTPADFSMVHPTIMGNPLPFHTATISSDGYACSCPDGYTGLDCSVPFKECNAANNYVCYNGGTCLDGLVGLLYCDCSQATGVGKFCEETSQLAESTECANNPNVNFCANRGTCTASFCSCNFPFVGAQCEYLRQTVPKCNLPCINGGTCRLGSGGNDGAVEYCQCHAMDYVGSFCEIPAVPCGDRNCQNGGTCVNDSHCDCTTADRDGFRWDGLSCQYRATSYCNENNLNNDPNGLAFCVNDGVCVQDGSSLAACQCVGFTGPRCELPVPAANSKDEPAIGKCNLQCPEGGHCRKGAKDLSFLEQFGVNVSGFERYNNDFEHCICPEGFVGLECNVKYQQCQDGNHVCLNAGDCNCDAQGCTCNCVGAFTGDSCEIPVDDPNAVPSNGVPSGGGFTTGEVMASATPCGNDFCLNGSQCVEIKTLDANGNETTSYFCDCTTIANPTALEFFAGASCEFQADMVCGGAMSSPNGVVFCTNGGMCPQEDPAASIANVFQRAGATTTPPNDLCTCNNPLFEGPRCEFLKDANVQPCDLACFNNGECRKGAKDVSFLKSFGVQSPAAVIDQRHNSFFEHCICPLGYVGYQCDVAYEKCIANSHICLNGGTCSCTSSDGKSQSCCQCPNNYSGEFCEIFDPPIVGPVPDSPTLLLSVASCDECQNNSTCVASGDLMSQTFHCDCTTAADPTNRIYYAGRACESPSTSVCTSVSNDLLLDPNGIGFCVNDGTCVGGNAFEGCTNCPADKDGPLCEFGAATTTTAAEACTLQCSNNGACRFGAKDVSFLTQFGMNTTEVDLLETRSLGDFQHCACPDGFVGVQCDVPYTICPGGSHICLQDGATCVLNDPSCVSIQRNACPATCSCPAGFGGDFCELEVDDDDSTPDDDDDGDAATPNPVMPMTPAPTTPAPTPSPTTPINLNRGGVPSGAMMRCGWTMTTILLASVLAVAWW